MRKSKAAAAETRQQIIDVAAREFRQNGLHETGLAGLMSRAGLTHGGFYRHFASKEQLVAEACAAALRTLVDGFEEAAHAGDKGFAAIVDGYVSVEHRDDRTTGCPLAALGSELSRADAGTRKVAAEGYRRLVDVMAANLDGAPEARHSQAVFAMAAMVGALTLSRIVDDTEVLHEVRRHLKES